MPKTPARYEREWAIFSTAFAESRDSQSSASTAVLSAFASDAWIFHGNYKLHGTRGMLGPGAGRRGSHQISDVQSMSVDISSRLPPRKTRNFNRIQIIIRDPFSTLGTPWIRPIKLSLIAVNDQYSNTNCWNFHSLFCYFRAINAWRRRGEV